MSPHHAHIRMQGLLAALNRRPDIPAPAAAAPEAPAAPAPLAGGYGPAASAPAKNYQVFATANR